jgi:adenylate cyclase
VFQTEGTLDKYIGDAIMAFWGAPTPQDNHAFRACSTALAMVDLLKGILHKKWELEGREKLRIGIGLNTGKMVVGFVGSENMKNYTHIGDAVNLCSRLEGATKQYKVDILIGEETYEAVKNDMMCRELDLIRVKGKTRPVRLYELAALKGKTEGNLELKLRTFEKGLAEYRARRFEEAIRQFRVCLDLDPEDGPAQVFTERCEVLKSAPPPADWDGVFTMKSK